MLKQLLKFNLGMYLSLMVGLIANIFGVLTPLILKKTVDIRDFKYLYFVVILLIIQTLLRIISSFFLTKECDKKNYHIRKKLISHIFKLPTSYFDKTSSGEIVSRIISDISSLKSFLTESVPQPVNGLTIVIGSLLILIFLDWKLTSILLILIPIFMCMAIPMGRIGQKNSEKNQTELSKLSGIITDNIKIIRTVKINTAEMHINEKIKGKIEQLFKVSLVMDKMYSVIIPLQNLLSLFIVILLFSYGNYRVKNGTLTSGTLVAFVFYLFQIIGPIEGIFSCYSEYSSVKGAIKKIKDILSLDEEKYGLKKNDEFQSLLSKDEIDLEIKEFSFETKKVLNKIKMNFKSGEKVAIVGPTGAGKSTIINLITRLYELPRNSGYIKLNNQYSFNIGLYSWRKQFGVVSQENSLISGTILENLLFGLDYRPSILELNNALRDSCLDKELLEFPNGIDTMIGEQGIKLSGGQRQRIQIARVYLKKSKIIILDEATSSLDGHTEAIITNNLNALAKNKVFISIAHRLSTIINSDKIYYLDDKSIVDVGTHEELLKRVPKYRKLIKEQMIER